MTQASFACPRCGYTTFLPSDVASGYCPQCRWWTGDSLLGSEDVLAQAEIDGPFVGSIGRPRCSTCGASADFDIMEWASATPVAYACEEHGEIRGDGSGEALPDLDPALADLVTAADDHCPDWQIRVLRAQRERVEAEWFGMPATVAECTAQSEPTFRVARFVQALRRRRRR